MRSSIKKILFLIMLTLCMLLILSINKIVNADEVTTVGTWNVSADDNKSNVTATLYSDGSFVISGTGDMKSFSKTREYSDYKEDIKTIEIKNGVTSIGDKAFEDCKSLTSIEIPNSVTSIGSSAFEYCTSLTSIEIPTSVTRIGAYVFNDCNSLTEIKVAEDNKNYSSEEGVLFNKDKTEIIKYPEGKTDNSYTIPNSVTSIGSWAFYNCTSLTSVTIPDSVTSIGSYAFEVCTSLTSVTIPDSVTSIENMAFHYCTSLASVTIGNSVTSIGHMVFDYCNSLTEIKVAKDNKNYGSEEGVLFNKDKTEIIKYPEGKTDNSYTIPNSVTSIEDYAFYYCKSLTSIEIPDSVTSIGAGAFYNCKSLTSIEIPDSVTSIEWDAFRACTSLTSIVIPDSVTSIGESAFESCTSLASIEIPNSVTSIKYRAFYYCTSLASIEIPNSVTSIGWDAFKDCKSLTKLYIPKTIIQMGKDIVDGDNDINVYVTSNSYAKTYVEENKIKYQIDDIAPTVNVERLQKGRISEFEVKAEDKDSGLATYAYSTDGVTYVKDNKITIPADKERITVYVIDKVGNVEETTIEKYKEIEENGLGDVNDDGKIDDKDVDMIKQYTSKSIELTEDQKVRADVNKDGTVDEVDEEKLTKYIQLQKPEDDNTTGKDDNTTGKDDNTTGKDDNTTGKDDNTTGKDDNTTGKNDNTTGKDDNTIGKNDNTTGGTEDSKNQNNGEETKNPQSNSENVKKYSSTTNVNSAKSLPYAGATPIILIGAIICSIIGVIGFVGYRKYRKLK